MRDISEDVMCVRTGETRYSGNSHLQDLTLFFFPQFRISGCSDWGQVRLSRLMSSFRSNLFLYKSSSYSVVML